jgi:hypothetical protein
LDLLIAFPGLDSIKKKEYVEEKLEILMRPIITLENCSVQRMTPSSATDTDDGAQRKSIACGFIMEPKTIFVSNTGDTPDMESFATASPGNIDGKAASTFASNNSDAGFEMTAHFHSKTIPHVTHENSELCYQPKHVLDDDLEERTTVFCRQRKLHLDAGYDPHPEETNTFTCGEDAKNHQSGFVTSFFEKFDCPVRPSHEVVDKHVSSKNSMFDAFVQVVNCRNKRNFGSEAQLVDISEMRNAISNHFRSHNGTIPGSGVDFQDDFCLIRHNFEGTFLEYCDELVLGRTGDLFVLHTFCHLYEFDAILFSVTEPGGSIFTNIEMNDVDVFSLLYVIDFINDEEESSFSLVVPKIGSVSFPLSFTIDDADALENAKEVLKNCTSALEQAKQKLETDESNARFRNPRTNQVFRTENQRVLQLAEVAHERALETYNDIIKHDDEQRSIMASSASSRKKFDGSGSTENVQLKHPQEKPSLISSGKNINEAVSTASTASSVVEHSEEGSKATKKKKSNPFEEYENYFDKLPVWNVDLRVCEISQEIGRGVRTMRKFFNKGVLGHYDGNRCDEKGNIILAVPTLKEFFCQYPTLDRSVSPSPFRKSHALCVGGTHISGLFIDGYPLCDPILDKCFDRLGKFAIANSASSHSTANMKPIWVLSPHLPPDKINKVAHLHCFFVATRDIEYVSLICNMMLF